MRKNAFHWEWNIELNVKVLCFPQQCTLWWSRAFERGERELLQIAAKIKLHNRWHRTNITQILLLTNLILLQQVVRFFSLDFWVAVFPSLSTSTWLNSTYSLTQFQWMFYEFSFIQSEMIYALQRSGSDLSLYFQSDQEINNQTWN